MYSTFLIFIILAVGQLFLSFFPFGRLGRLLCAFMIVAAKSAIYSTIRLMKAARQIPMRIYDVACKCNVNYPHHEGAYLIAKSFHEENSTALPIT